MTQQVNYNLITLRGVIVGLAIGMVVMLVGFAIVGKIAGDEINSLKQSVSELSIEAADLNSQIVDLNSQIADLNTEAVELRAKADTGENQKKREYYRGIYDICVAQGVYNYGATVELAIQKCSEWQADFRGDDWYGTNLSEGFIYP